MKTTTNLDLKLAAAAAAKDSLSITAEFDVEAFAMGDFKAFNGATTDTLDWPLYKEEFYAARAAYAKAATQPTLSTKAAQAAAAAAKTPAPASS